MRFSFGSFLIIVLICTSLTNPEPEQNFANVQSESSPVQSDEKPATNNPKFLTDAQIFRVREGDTTELPCEIEDLGEYVVLWKLNKTSVLFAGSLRISRDDRFQLNKSTLIIRGVASDNQGEYSCSLSTNPPQEIVHTVEVLSPPSIRTWPENGQVVAKKGDNLRLKCEPQQGSSPLRVYWRRVNGSLPEHHSQTETELIIPHIGRFDTGIYQCDVTNQIGNATSSFRVQVLHEPEIEVKEKFVHAEHKIGSEIELTCIVVAEPSASIFWRRTREGRVIMPSEKFVFRRHNSTVTLLIKEVSKYDYDNYTCAANNSIGQQSETIEVSGRPSSPIFKSAPLGPRENSYELEWEVTSLQPIIKYTIRFREARVHDGTDDPGEWKTIHVETDDDDDDPFRKGRYTFKDLTRATNYEIDLTSENEIGVSRSDVFAFVTADTLLDDYSSSVNAPANDGSMRLWSYSVIIIVFQMLLRLA